MYQSFLSTSLISASSDYVFLFYRKAIFGGPITAFVEAIKKLQEHFVELQKIYADIIDRVVAAYKESLPELQKSYKAINAAVLELFNEAVTTATNYVKSIFDLINAHKKEFEQIAAIGTELVQDIVKIVLKATEKIQSETQDFVSAIIKEFKTLPIYEIVEQKYKEFLAYDVSSAAIRVLDDVVRTIEQLLPSEELKNLLTSVHAYITKHLKHEKVWIYFVHFLKSVTKLRPTWSVTHLHLWFYSHRLTTYKNSKNCMATSCKRFSLLLISSELKLLPITSLTF